jgi:predicted MFS family arabinose efflux permease
VSTLDVPHSTAAPLTNGQLLMVTLGRLAVVTFFRLVYPLLPLFATQFQVPSDQVSIVVTLMMAAGLLNPLGGFLADRRGERTMMLVALGCLCVATLCCAFATSFTGILVGYVIGGVAIAFYQPAAQSYISARTPYYRRGRALGFYEISWAIAALIGVAPLMQLVGATGLVNSAFWILVVVGLIAIGLIWRLPATDQRKLTTVQRPATNWQILRQPAPLAMLGVFVAVAIAVDLYFVSQSGWLTEQFRATPAQLGQVFGLMGLAELCGSIGATLFVDRFGKKRSVVVGLAAMSAMAFALPFSAGNWAWFLPLLFLFDFWYEFAIVAAFPLASGVAPTMRGTFLALCGASISVGRTIGSSVAEPLRRAGGMGLNGGMAAAGILGAALLCWVGVREVEQDSERHPQA